MGIFRGGWSAIPKGSAGAALSRWWKPNGMISIGFPVRQVDRQRSLHLHCLRQTVVSLAALLQWVGAVNLSG
jgi:hypothetical protein